MILQELLKQVNWNCVWYRMEQLYPEQSTFHNNYKTVFEQCKKDIAVYSSMRILLRSSPSDTDSNIPWIEVYGCDGTTVRNSEDLNYNNWLTDAQLDAEVTYALDYTEWGKWVGMEIDSSALKEFTPVDIVVHCLYEMTYVSFNQDNIKKVLESLKEDVKKIESGEMKTYTTEEVFDKIRAKFNIGTENG